MATAMKKAPQHSEQLIILIPPGLTQVNGMFDIAKGSIGRIGEYGVIGAEQYDESHFDDRDSSIVTSTSSDNGHDHDHDNDDQDHGADGRIQFSTKKLYGRQDELNKTSIFMESYDDDDVDEKWTRRSRRRKQPSQ